MFKPRCIHEAAPPRDRGAVGGHWVPDPPPEHCLSLRLQAPGRLPGCRRHEDRHRACLRGGPLRLVQGLRRDARPGEGGPLPAPGPAGHGRCALAARPLDRASRHLGGERPPLPQRCQRRAADPAHRLRHGDGEPLLAGCGLGEALLQGPGAALRRGLRRLPVRRLCRRRCPVLHAPARLPVALHRARALQGLCVLREAQPPGPPGLSQAREVRGAGPGGEDIRTRASTHRGAPGKEPV
mmetsp:Transcript_104479/g.322322  ORF Transcript_104479/g.322322 Transcript_104479/m.322322 type:complete len:239 (+) Transcript_104479:381-1097(+)